jgi:uncharacterized membrane protein
VTNGVMQDLGMLGGIFSEATAINAGGMTDLGPTAGQAYGINRSGRVVGPLGVLRARPSG